jgi:hypothetical protein
MAKTTATPLSIRRTDSSEHHEGGTDSNREFFHTSPPHALKRVPIHTMPRDDLRMNKHKFAHRIALDDVELVTDCHCAFVNAQVAPRCTTIVSTWRNLAETRFRISESGPSAKTEGGR